MKYNLRKVEKVKKRELPGECTLVYTQKVYFGRNHWFIIFLFLGTKQEKSYGEAYDINRTVTRNSIHEQWLYGIGRYLYFEGNILTAIQD